MSTKTVLTADIKIVANTVLKCAAQNGHALDSFELQSALFLLNGWSLVNYNKPLCPIPHQFTLSVSLPIQFDINFEIRDTIGTLNAMPPDVYFDESGQFQIEPIRQILVSDAENKQVFDDFKYQLSQIINTPFFTADVAELLRAANLKHGQVIDDNTIRKVYKKEFHALND